MLQASIPGLIKTILIIIGAIVAIRFLGQMMNAKRNIEEEKELLRKSEKSKKDEAQARKDFGKVEIIKNTSTVKQKQDDKFDDAEIQN